MNKKYILFDLDGTLTDSKIGITKCVQYALEYFDIIEEDLNELCKFIGPPLRVSFMEYYKLNSEEAEIAVSKYRERYNEIGIFENKVYEGIPKLLKDLNESGKTLIVATSKPKIYAERIIKHFDLKKYFHDVCGSNLDGTLDKKEEVIEYALLSNNISNLDKVIMIGDRKHDIIGAKALKIESIGVLYGFGDYEELVKAGADYIASDIKELKRVLEI